MHADVPTFTWHKIFTEHVSPLPPCLPTCLPAGLLLCALCRKSEWVHLEGDFAGIMLVIMPCRSEKSQQGVARCAHCHVLLGLHAAPACWACMSGILGGVLCRQAAGRQAGGMHLPS